MTSKVLEIASMVLVGIFWGCTNPLIRRGSITESAPDADRPLLLVYLSKFLRVSVWLPYALNQLGSVVFYFTLSQADISIASPACNGLALAFSVVTSWWIGEKIRHPTRTIFGSALVMGGVGLCLYAKEQAGPN